MSQDLRDFHKIRQGAYTSDKMSNEINTLFNRLEKKCPQTINQLEALPSLSLLNCTSPSHLMSKMSLNKVLIYNSPTQYATCIYTTFSVVVSMQLVRTQKCPSLIRILKYMDQDDRLSLITTF